jgi:uncharacterized membrane protein
MDNLAERLSKWFGSSPFILFHVIWFTVWVVLHFTASFDEDWEILTIVVSLEAIFLSLFILRGDNIQAGRFEKDVKEDLRRSNEQLKLLKSINNKRK